jgi:hypothetical protein
LQERDQDLIPFHLAGEHPADVIAGLGFEPSDAQGNTVRHRITTNRKRLFESRSARDWSAPAPDAGAVASGKSDLQSIHGPNRSTFHGTPSPPVSVGALWAKTSIRQRASRPHHAIVLFVSSLSRRRAVARENCSYISGLLRHSPQGS